MKKKRRIFLAVFVLTCGAAFGLTGLEADSSHVNGLDKSKGVLKIWDYDNLGGIRLSSMSGAEAAISLDDQTLSDRGEKSLKLTLSSVPPEPASRWAVQLRYDYDGGLQAGKTYEVSFACQATEPGVVHMCAIQSQSPWKVVPGSESNIEVTEEWQEYKFTFIANKEWAGSMSIPCLMIGEYGTPTTLSIGPVTLREVPKRLPFSLGTQWQVFLGVDAPSSYDSVPSVLNGNDGLVHPQNVNASNGHIDLAELSEESGEGECAVLYHSFNSDEPGEMRLGLSADWKMLVYVNGQEVYDTTESGNGSNRFTFDDHVVDVPVKAGNNLLAVAVWSGSKGWQFLCGETSRAPTDAGLYVVEENREWKAVDMSKQIVQQGTALDFSHLLGAPNVAGDKGHLIVSHKGFFAFEREPDIPVRFLSFNCNLSQWRKQAHTWTKQDIENYANAIARQGYNMVRFHSLDRFLLGYKIHDRPRKSFAEAGIPQSVDDIAFDDNNYDRFEYLMKCLKDRGIYANLDLMTAETGYSLAYKHAIKREESFRIQLFINETFRTHWKIAVGYFLTRVNPYTGLNLKSDPMVAIVEPLNEQDFRLGDTKLIQALTPRFRDYLKQKYGSDEALSQAWGYPGLTFNRVPDINEELLRKGDVRSTDAGDFLISIMQEITEWYWEELEGIGYEGLFTQWDMIIRMMEVPVRALMPVIAQHCYFSHPRLNVLPTKNLVEKSKNWRYVVGSPDYDLMVSQSSSLNSSYFRAAAVARFLDRPFIITEYSHSAYNRFRHERGLYYGSYASLQGWGGLTAHGETIAVEQTTFEPFAYFENAQDPISRASETVAALAFLRGDVKEADHAVEYTLSNDEMFPHHYLSAIGDDYAKLAMVTKVGISYNEVWPLSPVGEVTPDLSIPVSEFTPLKVTNWFAQASSMDGEVFPELLDEVRGSRIIGESNKTDYDERIFQSDTGEITLYGKSEEMTVISPRLEGAILKKNHPVDLGVVSIQSCSIPASVVLASIDGKQPIESAKRLLLVVATNALNSGMTFENSNMLLAVEIGQFPVLIQTVELSLHLNGEQEGRPTVYALNMDGTRAEQVPCSLDDAGLEIQVDTSKLQFGTPYFEVVYPGFSEEPDDRMQ